ncbi:heterokaryon incompatibility protein-domain-containing protein [Aspergillus pseudoustus]|uniref:Heterokaryon incompatibility protein-domain-containing protein n=1 Tax=Aspergillus pseudoustus TaxID=1810923 RepID=A0ABR4ITM4_9EURO
MSSIPFSQLTRQAIENDTGDSNAETLRELHLWSNVEKYWPRRLLHIPTMTSLERTGQSTYGAVSEPTYAILSYTWGRWECQKSPAIQIQDTPWKIPGVKPEHFTPVMLQAVLDEVGKEMEYLWIDIACIDQEDQGVKMDEVGQQVSIFARASRTYVWLSHLEPKPLEEHLNDLSDYIVAIIYKEEDDWSVVAPALRRISECFDFLFQDPWFTSLWTLQEATLNKTALILSRDGRPVRRRMFSGDFFLVALNNETSNLLREIAMIERMCPQHIRGVQREIANIRSQCRKAGFQGIHINNPNVQYELVRYRKTTRPEDRIYGITQIYRMKVGQSVESCRSYTLQELRDQFAEALVTLYPAISQLFIHGGDPQPGQSWRITEDCEVPRAFLRVNVNEGAALCKFRVTAAKGVICTGVACSPRDLKLPIDLEETLDIFLDRKVEERLQISPHPYFPLREITGVGVYEAIRNMLDKLSWAFGPDSVIMVPLVFSGGFQLNGMLLRRADTGDYAQWERIGLFTCTKCSNELLSQCAEFCGELV